MVAPASSSATFELAPDGVVLGRPALTVLGLQECLDAFPAPAGRALPLPEVVVERTAADIEHRVHRARSPEALAARAVERAGIAARLRLGVHLPVELRLELLGERRRNRDVHVPALAGPGLDQHDAHVRVLRETVGENATG